MNLFIRRPGSVLSNYLILIWCPLYQESPTPGSQTGTSTGHTAGDEWQESKCSFPSGEDTAYSHSSVQYRD